MRLLSYNSDGEFILTEHFDDDIPGYAILSHTWGTDAEEPTFKNLMEGSGRGKAGYNKINFCGEQARRDGLRYFWVDTCCIDKTNSTELAEAINSMFHWYRNAAKCYVYLSDVSTGNQAGSSRQSWESSFWKSRWFTRGWTLQELIAPLLVIFFCSDGKRIGDKKSLERQLHEITGIAVPALQGTTLSTFSVKERMSWAVNRKTKRAEDKAYSLLGIFDVYMPLIYGEGVGNAFRRLQEELSKPPREQSLDGLSTIPQATSNPTKQVQASYSHLSPVASLGAPKIHSEYAAHGAKSGSLPVQVGEGSSMRQLGDALLETGKEPPARASDRIKDKDKKSLIDQLYFANIDERLTTLTAAQGTTCRWFITKSEYVSWYDMAQGPDYCGFLWIKGNPGTGKSTLMKFLFEEARLNTKGDPSQITLSFFFLARGTVEEKSTIGLYRSLLHQIFEKAIDLKDSLEWMTPDGAKVIQRNGWNEEALKQTLTHAIRMLGTRSLTIFVDALDECDKKQVADMVCFFEELCDGARETQAQLRICFSSRHYPTIVIQKGIELVLEHEIGHSEDIKHYIKSKLRLGNSAQAELLRTEILEKSSRIFLWVVLVLDILNSEYPNSSFSIKKIREHLKKIPPKLTDLFEMILMRDGENLEQLQLCLKWILFATRPLTPQELYVAIQLGLDKECSSYWDPEDVGSDQMKTFVRSSSKGLAEVTPTTSEVQFIHESIRDFLLGKYGGQWSGSDNFVGHSHEVLKNCCMAQLNASIPQNMDILRSLSQASKALRLRLQGGNFNEETLKLRKRFSLESPFLKYAVCNVLHHANSAQQNAIEQRDFLANFPRQWWTIFDNTFRDSWTALDFYEESTSLLYILAADNLADLIRVHPQRVSCFDVENNETYGPPIFAALATESHEAVQAFLEIQAGIQPQDPLLYALYKDYCAKRNKCTNNSRTFAFQRYKNIFSYLIELGNEIVLAFLCASAKFNVESKDTFDRTPLLWAAESGEEAVVKILLKRGAELEAEDEYGQTPLSRAAESGHEEVVRLLLEKGANPQARDKVNWTPLSYAAKNGHRAVTKLLVERGANLEDENSYGWTPLLRAAEGGYEAVVKLLLEQGANLEAENCYGWTALSLAAANGHGAVAKLLLEKGVHPEARSSYGQTPLSLAAENGHQAVVQLLLKKGADQEAKDNHGQTPLSWATKNGHEEVVMLLRISAGKPHESGFYYSRDKR